MSKRDRYRRTFRLTEHSEDVPRDVEDELSFYLEMRERELVAEGFSREEARRGRQAASTKRCAGCFVAAIVSARRAGACWRRRLHAVCARSTRSHE